MSDDWIYYPCQMGENFASIFYDHGIRDSIDTIAPSHLLKVQAAFKQSQANGLPTNEEFPHLSELEDGVQALAEQHKGIYVGRVTVGGYRHFYIYTADSEEAWASRLDQLGESHSYTLEFTLERDKGRDGYWQELFPTEDDWQVIKDIGVIEVLGKHGDDGTASRQIDHWAYFPSQDAAEQFCRWAQEKEYVLGGNDKANNEKVCVRFTHIGTLQLADITSHTIALRRMASELGGDYDGWEVPVCKDSAQP